jgi:hypothetical protein
MGRRETEHKGEKDSKGEPAAFVLSCAQGGHACSRGLQAFARERDRLSASPFSRAANPLVREPMDLPFIGVRRGPRCTMGV